MDIKQNAKRKTYSKDFKLSAVKMKLEQGFAKGRILEELGIPAESMDQLRLDGKAPTEVISERLKEHSSEMSTLGSDHPGRDLFIRLAS